MTAKQIIIDGVNVLNCGHYSQFEGETENACYIMQKTFIGKEEISKEYCSCETYPNCYYKQLKRKEQELEQYKKSKQASYETMQTEWNEAINEVSQLKKENEELKKRNKNLDNSITNALNRIKHLKEHTPLYCRACKGKEDYTNLERHYEVTLKCNHKYLQAIKDIKELCNIGIVNGLSEEQYLAELRSWQKQILQKCEVLKDE